MAELSNIKSRIAAMSKLSLKMWQETHAAFMEHDLQILSGVLEQEVKLNALEEELTISLVELGRTTKVKADKAKALIYADVVADLELIGDYCKDILERVQIKIEEKLLFSDDAVKEYVELYRKTESSLKEITEALDKDKPGLVQEVRKGQGHIDKMVDEYRRRHNQRLIDGICSPIACNMFLNMLDFTAAIYYHTKKIARNLLKIKS
jgi:phosphate:Na+ symporter